MKRYPPFVSSDALRSLRTARSSCTFGIMLVSFLPLLALVFVLLGQYRLLPGASWDVCLLVFAILADAILAAAITRGMYRKHIRRAYDDAEAVYRAAKNYKDLPFNSPYNARAVIAEVVAYALCVRATSDYKAKINQLRLRRPKTIRDSLEENIKSKQDFVCSCIRSASLDGGVLGTARSHSWDDYTKAVYDIDPDAGENADKFIALLPAAAVSVVTKWHPELEESAERIKEHLQSLVIFTDSKIK